MPCYKADREEFSCGRAEPVPEGDSISEPSVSTLGGVRRKAESRQGRHTNPERADLPVKIVARFPYVVPKGTREGNTRVPSVRTLGLDMPRLRRCVVPHAVNLVSLDRRRIDWW